MRIERRGYHAFHPVISLPMLGQRKPKRVCCEHQVRIGDQQSLESTKLPDMIHLHRYQLSESFTPPQWLFIHTHINFVMTFTGIISSPFRRLKSVRVYTTTTTNSPNSGYKKYIIYIHTLLLLFIMNDC